MNKNDVRKAIADGMITFLASGKKISKGKSAIPKKYQPYKVSKEEIVEIQVDLLPEALRKKHFGDLC